MQSSESWVVIYAYKHHVRLLSPEPMVVKQPQFTRAEEPTLYAIIWICPSNAASQKSSVTRPGKTTNSDNPSAESIPHGFSVLTRTNSRPVASLKVSNTSHGIFPVVGYSLGAMAGFTKTLRSQKFAVNGTTESP